MRDVPRDDAADAAFRVQLADARDQHRPRDTSTEAHHVPIDCSPYRSSRAGRVSSARGSPNGQRAALTLSPQLDRSERFPEHGHVRNQPEHLIRYSRASETPDAALVEVPEEVVVFQFEVVGDGREGETRKEEIDVDPGKRALDDRDKGFRDGLSVKGRAGRPDVSSFKRRSDSSDASSYCPRRLTVTSTTPSVSLSIDSNRVWNSSRSTCRGTTRRVSISEPGPCTPKRYDPNVKILPPL